MPIRHCTVMMAPLHGCNRPIASTAVIGRIIAEAIADDMLASRARYTASGAVRWPVMNSDA